MNKINVRAGSFRQHVDARRLREAAHKTLVHQKFPVSAELTLVITDDDEIRQLNRRYRGIDRPTDVLSFGETLFDVKVAPNESIYLGDVIISYPRAEAQAQSAGRATADELVLLVVHGVLHLLGHEHATKSEKRKMWAAQDALLAEMDARVTLPKQ
jgi:probable rRNA maturation factor